MKLKLFQQIQKGFPFFFVDKPDRILVKNGDNLYAAPEGVHKAHPHVLVAEKEYKPKEAIK